jgi:hypothetical protein
MLPRSRFGIMYVDKNNGRSCGSCSGSVAITPIEISQKTPVQPSVDITAPGVGTAGFRRMKMLF